MFLTATSYIRHRTGMLYAFNLASQCAMKCRGQRRGRAAHPRRNDEVELNKSKPIPIFRNLDETYRADTCLPLVGAVERGLVRLHGLAHGHYPGRKLPPDILAGVKSIGYWDAAGNQDWGLPWHRNEGIEFTLLESGETEFAVGEQYYVLHPGDLSVTRPWQKHRVGNPNVGAGRLHFLIIDVGVRRPNQIWQWPPWLVLAPRDRDELTGILRQNEQPVWKATPDIRRCFKMIAKAVERDCGGTSGSQLGIRVNELLLLVLLMLRTQNVALDETLSSSRRTVELFLADLRAHPEHLALEWNLEKMARSCGLGPTRFVQYVKALTKMTPGHFLNHCRLETAAACLREHPEMTVTDVAGRCGFSSGQYFATVFGDKYGRAPNEYRANHRPV